MKGDGQTWNEFNTLIFERLHDAIQVRKRGDDAYKRWPLDTLELVMARFVMMENELDKAKETE